MKRDSRSSAGGSAAGSDSPLSSSASCRLAGCGGATSATDEIVQEFNGNPNVGPAPLVITTTTVPAGCAGTGNSETAPMPSLDASAKLPTGDADRLLGSGGTDFSVGLAGDVFDVGGEPNFSLFYRASLSYLGKPDLLSDIYRELVGQASAGFAYSLHPRFALNAQTTFRTATYDSDIEKLGGAALTLTFGGTITLSDRLLLALGVIYTRRGTDDLDGFCPDQYPQIRTDLFCRYPKDEWR